MGNRTVVVSAARKREDGVDQVRLNTAYVSALESAGLIPVIVPPLLNAADTREVVTRAGGLVLTGGGDLDPALYGQERHPGTYDPEEGRDQTELVMVEAARTARIPTLGICRGIQTINVALGGSLVQDIPSGVACAVNHDTAPDRTLRVHDVEIEPGTRLAAIAGATRIRVNSLHHQSVDRVAEKLRVSARSEDGVVEAVESEDSWWMVAVQWHPEELQSGAEPWDRALLSAFAQAVRQQG